VNEIKDWYFFVLLVVQGCLVGALRCDRSSGSRGSGSRWCKHDLKKVTCELFCACSKTGATSKIKGVRSIACHKYSYGWWYCCVGRSYIPIRCQYKPPLYLAPFGRNLRLKFLLGLFPPNLDGSGGHMGLEMDPLSSQGSNCYRAIVSLGLSLTVFVVLRLVMVRQTDRQNWYHKRWH